MIEVKILVEGVHKKTADGRIDIGATTTLIKSDINIIVDPGSFINKDKLVEALKNEGLETKDIDAVILTHSHLDHTANAFLFPQARIYNRFISGDYPGQFQRIDQGYVERFNLLQEPIAEGVKILDTAGHSIDHISILIETDLGRVVIAGDAIAGNIWADISKQPEVTVVYSVEKYNQSREKILAVADYIIPGHGAMFKVEK